jgi:hypothetical protein
VSFIARLKEGKRKVQARTDPWLLRLERLKGKTWGDGIERISTQTVFDILEVPHRSRTAGGGRRLSKLMRDPDAIELSALKHSATSTHGWPAHRQTLLQRLAAACRRRWRRRRRGKRVHTRRLSLL